jgi:hypothetical protein
VPPKEGTPKHQEFFYNKPLGVPLCLCGYKLGISINPEK